MCKGYKLHLLPSITAPVVLVWEFGQGLWPRSPEQPSLGPPTDVLETESILNSLYSSSVCVCVWKGMDLRVPHPSSHQAQVTTWFSKATETCCLAILQKSQGHAIVPISGLLPSGVIQSTFSVFLIWLFLQQLLWALWQGQLSFPESFSSKE